METWLYCVGPSSATLAWLAITEETSHSRKKKAAKLNTSSQCVGGENLQITGKWGIQRAPRVRKQERKKRKLQGVYKSSLFRRLQAQCSSREQPGVCSSLSFQPKSTELLFSSSVAGPIYVRCNKIKKTGAPNYLLLLSALYKSFLGYITCSSKNQRYRNHLAINKTTLRLPL